MYIDCVTFTGADETVSPEELVTRCVALTENTGVPIELGILVGREYIGSKRFPGVAWIQRFVKAYEQVRADTDLFVSAHLCGDYVREFLQGANPVKADHPNLYEVASRMQLNTHGVPHTWNAFDLFKTIESIPKEVIFQLDGVNDEIFRNTVAKLNPSDNYKVSVTCLFDKSHGAGVHTKVWPSACYAVNVHGYAGGISPENLRETLEDISLSVGQDQPIWLDMETRIRDEEDKFSLSLVTDVMEQLDREEKGTIEEVTE